MLPYRQNQRLNQRTISRMISNGIPYGEVVRFLRSRLNHGAARLGSAAAVGAAGAAAMRYSQARPVEVAGSAVRSGKLQMVQGSMGGVVGPKINPKKRRRGSGRKVFSKPAMKVIKKVAKKANNWVFLGKWFRNDMHQITSAVNKVAWNELIGATDATWMNFLQHEKLVTTISGTTGYVTEEPEDIAGTTGASKAYLIIQSGLLQIRNNNVGPVELVLYHVRCRAGTNNSPLTDLTNRITATFYTKTTTSTSTPSAPLAKEDNFQQYWKTPLMREALWDVKSLQRFTIAAGDEIKVPYKIKIPINLLDVATTSYDAGQEFILTRQVGVPTHSVATPANNGISNTRLDILMMKQFTAFSCDRESPILANRKTLANSGFSAIADPEIAGDANESAMV